MENQTGPDKKYVNDKLVPSAHLHYGDLHGIVRVACVVIYQIQRVTITPPPLINTSAPSTEVMNPPNF